MSQDPAPVAPPPWKLSGVATAIFFRRGALAFIRYTESNVGPYDELLWLEPFQKGPAGRAHRVAPIYVSSEASARSGRSNWGLPKELAEFRVSFLRANEERVKVTRAGQLIASFVRPRPRATLPLDLSGVPSQARKLVQIYDGRAFETVPELRARFRLTRVSELEVDRELLPHAQNSRWQLGMHLSPFELCFPAARIFEVGR